MVYFKRAEFWHRTGAVSLQHVDRHRESRPDLHVFRGELLRALLDGGFVPGVQGTEPVRSEEKVMCSPSGALKTLRAKPQAEIARRSFLTLRVNASAVRACRRTLGCAPSPN